MKIGIIGYGYWGTNLVRNFSVQDGCQLAVVADSRTERLDIIKKNYPSVRTTTNADDVFNDTTIDAVVIATPVFTHFELAKKALEHDKHVLVEKPITSSSAEAQTLIDLSVKKNKVLMVDHTFLYTGAVQKMKQLVDSGDIGKVNYFDSTRINLGLFQQDVNVLWDLAPHDISILTYLINEKPVSINATGISHTKNEIENIAYMTVNFQSDLVAHFNCSWSSPVKIRMTLVGGDKKMIVFNDMEPTEKVKVYDTGYSVKTMEEKQRLLIDYRAGDIFIPKLQTSEALSLMAKDFISAITKGTKPVSDCYLGLEVVKILEGAQKSIKQKGKEILL
ncbi:MAG: Gfo/Idh/MocA family oxidoreductase [Bacteroidia bacterium]|jgi:predicted dehydrogenase